MTLPKQSMVAAAVMWAATKEKEVGLLGVGVVVVEVVGTLPDRWLGCELSCDDDDDDDDDEDEDGCDGCGVP